jgi:hypothetical protein
MANTECRLCEHGDPNTFGGTLVAIAVATRAPAGLRGSRAPDRTEDPGGESHGTLLRLGSVAPGRGARRARTPRATHGSAGRPRRSTGQSWTGPRATRSAGSRTHARPRRPASDPGPVDAASPAVVSAWIAPRRSPVRVRVAPSPLRQHCSQGGILASRGPHRGDVAGTSKARYPQNAISKPRPSHGAMTTYPLVRARLGSGCGLEVECTEAPD